MTAEKKKILFITGTRADFGKLKPLMEKVENSSEFECYIFSTGMHTLSRYGSTYDEILKSGFRNVFLYINQMVNQSSAMDIILANTINGFGHYVREFSPDLIVVHGDRVETLAGAIVGTLNNILVAHIEGGEVSGTVDELLRHAVSKLAHIHFVANEESLQRLIQMGEVKDSIYVIGSPDIDVMLSDRLPSLHEAKQYYGIPFDEYFLFLYHPVTTELHQLVNGVDAIVGTLEESGKNFIVVYPNNDKGSEIILEALLKLEGNEHFRLFPSLRFEYFLTLIRHARAILGNSSAGIRVAPVYGIPAINIGSRQSNRFRHTLIVNVREDKDEILNALNKIPTEKTTSLHFGSGKSAEKFINIIKQSAFWQRSCQKQFQDLVITQLSE